MTKSPAPGAARDRAATERAIVEAAGRLLAERGFSALNVQALAELAGVDRKLVYRYFGGVEGVVERLGADARWTLGEAAEAPAEGDYGAVVADLTLAYGRALSADPTLRGLAAWEMVEDTPLLRRLDAARSAALGAWAGQRLAGVTRPDGVDGPAINAVLVAAVQLLALRREQQRAFSGVALDEAGWARIEAAVKTLADGVYGTGG
jgi:AcrR family transcriptional regulator